MKDKIIEELKKVYDPEMPSIDVFTLGIIYDIDIKDEKVEITHTLTSMFCPMADEISKNIKEAVENPQIKSRNMIVDTFHKVVGDFKTAGNPIKMSSYKDETKRGDIPDLDEHRKKIIEEFCN